jgi:glycosyltransferase involved in cell wall biosynthesis
MKIAIIGYGFSGSTLPLAKALASENYIIDCYYLINSGTSELEALDLGKRHWIPMLKKLDSTNEVFEYLQSKYIRIFTMTIFRRIYKIEKYQFRLIWLVNKWIIKKYCRQIIKEKYDYINIVGHSEEIKLFNNCLNTVKIIHSVHEVFDNHFSEKKKINSNIKFLLNNKYPVVIHSEKSKQDLLGYFEVDKSILFKINFGQFESYAIFDKKDANITKKKNYLLFFGHILPYKGLNILYDAIQIVKNRININVVVAGDGHDTILTKMKKDPHFEIINHYLSNTELVYLIKNCKAVVCPYLSASQSGITQTTSLFGKPVIATDVGAFSETITNGINGILISPNNPTVLANAIISMFKEEKMYSDFCYNLLHYSEFNKMFDWKEIASEYKNKLFI